MDTQNAQTENLPKTEVSTPCRKHVKDENATFLGNLKDHMNEFFHTSMDEHKTCFQNTMNKLFNMSKAVEAKEVENQAAAVTK